MFVETSIYQEPPLTYWRDATSYAERLRTEFLAPLQQAAAVGNVSETLQVDVLRRLHWYFTVDGRERAPTVKVSVEAAPAFHALIGEILGYIDPQLIARFADAAVSPEIRHVLYSWHGPALCSVATVDAYDHVQQLIKLCYFVHGEPPAEEWLIDGQVVPPAYGKYRGCRYYHRSCMQQRIVWLPVAQGRQLQLKLNGQTHAIALDATGFFPPQVEAGDAFALTQVQAAFWPGRGGRRRSRPLKMRLKAGVLAALARLPWVRRKYRNAWVLVDRTINADDNAEHMYRWLKEHQPHINTWFLLNPDSADWPRLEREGFRLLAPDSLQSKLLVLNSEHIISSHAEYAWGGLDPQVYAPYMRWRASFLAHGFSCNDVSHWLGAQNFDFMITGGPPEWQSFISDGSNYPYTAREARPTGFPRHDRLLQRARKQPPRSEKRLVVMPTWRGGIFEERTRHLTKDERLQFFRDTAYCQAWKTLLHHPQLLAALQQYGWRIDFLPHSNVQPFLAAFEFPDTVQVVSMKEQNFQDVLRAADGLLTDYTSVAFEMALLRKPVFYYQFDREDFYGGGHNWRPGYFDYERDGFGPVAFDEDSLLQQLVDFFAQGGTVPAVYRQRMEQAVPLDDEQACQRCFDCIQGLNQPWPAGQN